jgi:hypothetical protein
MRENKVLDWLVTVCGRRANRSAAGGWGNQTPIDEELHCADGNQDSGNYIYECR